MLPGFTLPLQYTTPHALEIIRPSGQEYLFSGMLDGTQSCFILQYPFHQMRSRAQVSDLIGRIETICQTRLEKLRNDNDEAPGPSIRSFPAKRNVHGSYTPA